MDTAVGERFEVVQHGAVADRGGVGQKLAVVAVELQVLSHPLRGLVTKNVAGEVDRRRVERESFGQKQPTPAG